MNKSLNICIDRVNRKWFVLPIIVISQFFCTSLWFAGNAVVPDLAKDGLMSASDLSHMSAAVQFGFITGTFVFAFLSVSDRFAPSKVFFFSALAASFSNILMVHNEYGISMFLILRFMTGFFLAGIYPVGMKIAADYYEKGLGKALGFLVGALVVGTAFPFLLRSFDFYLPWKLIMYFTSALAVTGGLMIFLFVPNGPFRKKNLKLDLASIPRIFKDEAFRTASFGYFGHMWELYAFWTFIPFIFDLYIKLHPEGTWNVPLLSFIVIGCGSLSCVASGFFAEKIGTKATAFLFLLMSCLCCVISPFIFNLSFIFFFSILVFWGLTVVADSPMFSTLVAQNAPAELKGSALTIVTCIGFLITILSIEIIGALTVKFVDRYVLVLLAIGPVLGLKQLVR